MNEYPQEGTLEYRIMGNNWSVTTDQSVTLRDYFAAKAMQGIITYNGDGQILFDSVANMAYLMADAMLERRKK